MLCNNLKLNSDKTEMLVIGTRQQHAKVLGLSIKIDGDTIEPIDEAQNLGIIFDKHMTLKAHVNAVYKLAKCYLHNINVAQKYLTAEAAEKVIHVFVVSWLDGTNSLLYGLLAIELKKLQKIQYSAARILTGASKYDHITPVLKQLHWLPVSRIEYKILMLAFKFLHGLAPHYLQALVPKYEPACMTRSACDSYLLKHNWTSLKTVGDRSFSYAAPTLWYKLPYGSFHVKEGQHLHPPFQIFLKFTPLIHIPEARRNAKFQPQNLIPSKVMAFYILGQNSHISPCCGHFGFS